VLSFDRAQRSMCGHRPQHDPRGITETLVRTYTAPDQPVWPTSVRRPGGLAEQITGLRLVHEAAHAIVARSYGHNPSRIWVHHPTDSAAEGLSGWSAVQFDGPATWQPAGRVLAVIAWASWPAMWRYWRHLGHPLVGNTIPFARECRADFHQARTALQHLPGRRRANRDQALTDADHRVTRDWVEILDLAQLLADHHGRLPALPPPTSIRRTFDTPRPYGGRS
jgi:hypothetical protein